MKNEPLAIKLRPKKLSDIVGQKHLVGEGKIISNMIKNKKLFSMILYGDPGIGKTSIANAIANELGENYRFLNATVNKKSDFDVVVEEAKMYGGMILIMDEIHRLNKDKQDLLLPCLESGLITLIGMTTANVFHSINPAIRSRCQLFELKKLTEEEIEEGITKATKSEYLKDIKIDNKTIKYLATLARHDLRYAYNLLEVAYYYNENHEINIDTIKNINSTPVIDGDKNEDGYYDLLSGLQKSIRGSDVNAALHYLARLITLEDLESITRRLAVIAYEDIGLANPNLGPIVESGINLSLRVGFPEASIILSNIVIQMALSPKSNTAYLAINNAIEEIKLKDCGNIPKYLKSPFNGYLYPHDYKNTIVKQTYLPDKIKDSKYFKPKDSSKYEKSLKDIYEKIEKLKNQI